MSLLTLGIKAALSTATAWKIAKGAWIGGTVGYAAHRYYQDRVARKQHEVEDYEDTIAYLQDKIDFLESHQFDDRDYMYEDDYHYHPRRRTRRRYSDEMHDIMRQFI